MFYKITLSTYGRCIRTTEWSIFNSIGTNRLYYMQSGNVMCQCGSNTIELKEKHLYLFPQNLYFKTIVDSGTCVDHTFFDFWTIPALKKDSETDINYSEHPLIYNGLMSLMGVAEQYPMYPIVKRNRYYNVVKSYLENLLYLINDEYPISLITDPAINDSITYIHEHYYQNIKIKDLAQKSGLNVGTYIEKFKLYTNQTPLQYIKNHRLNIAYNLLKTKNNSLSEIAEMVGYQDSSALSHAFKKTYGVYPKNIDKI